MENPITRKEKILNAISSGKDLGFKPITREEMYLAYLAGIGKKPEKPITRKEMFLDKIGLGSGGGTGGGGDTPTEPTYYTIRFLNGDTVLQISQVAFGEMPVYKGEEPTKEDYAFIGWTPTISKVVGNADYQANFKSTKSQTRAYIDNTITDFSNNVVTKIGKNVFQNYSTLIQVDCPNVTFIGEFSFYNTSNLTTINFPKAENTGSWAFQNCGNLTTISFPLATNIGSESFRACVKLAKADFPMATSIETRAFYGCSALKTLILRSETMCTLNASDAFTSTAIANGTGYIYVPSALVEDYKTQVSWETYANQFRVLEDWTVDGTITGAMDWGKINAA